MESLVEKLCSRFTGSGGMFLCFHVALAYPFRERTISSSFLGYHFVIETLFTFSP